MVINGLTQFSITLQIGRRTLTGSRFHLCLEDAQKAAQAWAADYAVQNGKKASVLEVKAA